MSYIEVLYSALRSDLGVVVETDNITLFRQKLYEARQKAADPDLAILSFCVSPTSPETELFIIKRPPDAKES